MKAISILSSLSFLVAVASADGAPNLISDPGTYGPTLEIAHYYYDQWPTGITVSSTGRKFTNYRPAIPAVNYTVSELTSENAETPYPSADYNIPPGGRINYTTSPPTGANTPDHFVGVQSVVVDTKDRLWALDTGRAVTPNGTVVTAVYGGPKLVCIDLATNEVVKTILFTPAVAPPDNYLNDVRFDLTPSATASGEGVAYITDSSPEGRNAIVIVDLGTGEAWRHLSNSPTVRSVQGFVPTIWGQPIYTKPPGGVPYTTIAYGADAIALNVDKTRLYWSIFGGRELYSASTESLRARGPTSELLCEQSVQYHGQKGLSDGMEFDSNNVLYAGNMEANAVAVFRPEMGTVETFVRDPRISWIDTIAVGPDGYLYFTNNQLWLGPFYNEGQEKRVKPAVLFRAKLPNNGTRISH